MAGGASTTGAAAGASAPSAPAIDFASSPGAPSRWCGDPAALRGDVRGLLAPKGAIEGGCFTRMRWPQSTSSSLLRLAGESFSAGATGGAASGGAHGIASTGYSPALAYGAHPALGAGGGGGSGAGASPESVSAFASLPPQSTTRCDSSHRCSAPSLAPLVSTSGRGCNGDGGASCFSKPPTEYAGAAGAAETASANSIEQR